MQWLLSWGGGKMTKKKHTYAKEIRPKKGFAITSDIQKVIWSTGDEHYIDIPNTFKEKHTMKLWCEQNCQYPVVFYNDYNDLSYMYDDFDEEKNQARMFFFDKEDAMAFKLRWS